MSLKLSLRSPSEIPIEADGVLGERLVGLSLDAIRRLPIHRGNAPAQLGDFFDVAGSADDETIVWSGDLRKVKSIAARQTRGRVIVEGDAGMHLAAEMRGGDVEVRGNVGDWMGAEMRGGLVRVRGDAGCHVGGAYVGSRRGMTGGEILIDGNAGHEVGSLMRRGLIVIGKSAGHFVGSGMIAGTILVGGTSGSRPGAGMKRGTLGLFGTPSPEILPTFRDAGVSRPTFLALYARRLQQLGFERAADMPLQAVRRFFGDFLELGKGEILTRVA
jgi:formylmethanofuran dehydrogenase subunit C